MADEALEDALYDSQALRDFVGIDLSRESVWTLGCAGRRSANRGLYDHVGPRHDGDTRVHGWFFNGLIEPGSPAR